MQALARQIKQLANTPPEGIRYVPTDSITEILCEIDGPTGTPYEGGTFQVKLILGNEYPTAPPKGMSKNLWYKFTVKDIKIDLVVLSLG